MSRIAQQAYALLWRRKLPHGLLTWRFAVPGTDPRIRAHANLWWQSRGRCPRIAWLIIEFWLWFRWVTFLGWISIRRVMGQRADGVRSKDGISRSRQFRTLIRLSIGCCVAPCDVYRFRLFSKPDRVWEFVFDHEIHAYHRSRSRPLGNGNASRKLLADKVQQTETFAARGVPMSPILACVSQGQASDILKWIDAETKLFCKTRSGNRAIGAFATCQTADGVRGRLLTGSKLLDSNAVCKAWRQLLERDDVLIQPALVNHPFLAELGIGDDVVTVRYVSHFDGSDITCLTATLEVPADCDSAGCSRYVVLPIDADTGQVGPFPSQLIATEDAQRRHDDVLSRLPTDRMLPDWEIVVDESRTAHQRVPDLWAVAWDWVLTPSGPQLLEGNSGWDGNTPQMLLGGFLR